jgi:hypothetical protein
MIIAQGDGLGGLALGYYHIVPSGLQFGALRSHGRGTRDSTNGGSYVALYCFWVEFFDANNLTAENKLTSTPAHSHARLRNMAAPSSDFLSFVVPTPAPFLRRRLHPACQHRVPPSLRREGVEGVDQGQVDGHSNGQAHQE